jgi:hypothetical protein
MESYSMKDHAYLPILLLSLLMSLVQPGNGQNRGGVTPPLSPQPAQNYPDHILFRNFFAHLKHLEDKSKAPKSTAGEKQLNEHYKKKLKLNEDEYRKLLKIASDCETELAAHKARRMPIIKNLRARIPGGRLPSKQAPPPVPPEVMQLQQEYEGIVARFSGRIKSELSQGKSAEITDFLKREFGSQLRVAKLDVTRERTPGAPKSSDFSK